MTTQLQPLKFISNFFEKPKTPPDITLAEAKKLIELTSNREYTTFKMTREGKVMICLADSKIIPVRLAMNIDNSVSYFSFGANQTTKINTPETASKLAQALANKKETKKDLSLYEIYLLFKHDKSREYNQNELQSAILDDSDFINYLKSFGQSKIYIKTQTDLNVAFNANIIKISPSKIKYNSHSDKAKMGFDATRDDDVLGEEFDLNISNKVKSNFEKQNSHLGVKFFN